jgi:hypothetical protein
MQFFRPKSICNGFALLKWSVLVAIHPPSKNGIECAILNFFTADITLTLAMAGMPSQAILADSTVLGSIALASDLPVV